MIESRKFNYRAGEFQKNTFQNYNLSWNLSALLAISEPFPGFRRCLVAGFSAWMLNPEDKLSRKIAITEEVARVISDKEKDLSKKGDIYTPMLGAIPLLGKDFYVEIYSTAGRMGGIRNLSRRNSFVMRTQNRRLQIAEAITHITIMHHIADQADPSILPPSLNKSTEVASVHFRASGKTQAIKNWKYVRSNIAFAYAANSIERRGVSLFGLLRSRRTSRISAKEMRMLLMRARYTCDHVLSHIQERPSSGEVAQTRFEYGRTDTPFMLNLSKLPKDISPDCFEPPSISKEQSNAILSAFRKKR